jgi:hypothetical protein
MAWQTEWTSYVKISQFWHKTVFVGVKYRGDEDASEDLRAAIYGCGSRHRGGGGNRTTSIMQAFLAIGDSLTGVMTTLVLANAPIGYRRFRSLRFLGYLGASYFRGYWLRIACCFGHDRHLIIWNTTEVDRRIYSDETSRWLSYGINVVPSDRNDTVST